MVHRKVLSKEQVLTAMEKGEFGSDVISEKANVVVVMTQDWCPQWTSMQDWLYDFPTHEDIAIYELVYNKVDYFREFMHFKESMWKNDAVPYLRYYNKGTLVNESNYVRLQRFKTLLGIG